MVMMFVAVVMIGGVMMLFRMAVIGGMGNLRVLFLAVEPLPQKQEEERNRGNRARHNSLQWRPGNPNCHDRQDDQRNIHCRRRLVGVIVSLLIPRLASKRQVP